MNTEPIDSYYTRTANPAPPRPALDGEIETDVCIVGGGLAGLSTALSLAERGKSVVVLEARRVAWGASSRRRLRISPEPSDEPSHCLTLSPVIPQSMMVNGSVTTSGGRPRAGGGDQDRSAARMPRRRSSSRPQ